MPLRSVASEDGYTLRGGAPKDVNAFPGGAMLFWGWVVELGIKAKDRDLSQGLDKDGHVMHISAKTREHRHSAMTPTGKGDPRAPALEPGWQKSRTRSLLTGRPFPDHAEFWWKFDPWTGTSWAEVLRYQADQGRDVFGLSPEALARVERQALALWAKWTKGKAVPAPVLPSIPQAPLFIPQTGRMDLTYATMGIGGPGKAAMVPGQFSGGMTSRELIKHLRTPAKVTIPGRPKAEYNVLLQHIYGTKEQLPPIAPIARLPIPPKPPKPVPIVKVAMKAKPIAKPKPAPVVKVKSAPVVPIVPSPVPPTPPVSTWKPGTPIRPDLPIAERIKLAHPAQAKLEAVLKIKADLDAANVAEDAAVLAIRNFEYQVRAGKVTGGKAHTELTRLEKEEAVLRQARKDLQSKVQSQVQEILKVSSLDRQSFNHDDGIGDWSEGTPNSKARNEGRAWLEPKLREGGKAVEIKWNAFPGIRAGAPHGVIDLSTDGSVRTAVHEMGHQLEYQVPGVQQAVQEFLAHRIKGYPLQQLNKVFPKSVFRDNEIGTDDDFGKAFDRIDAFYAGKVYANGTDSEIMPMGLQKLLEDPIRLAQHDPEFFKLVVGILDGSLRKP